MLWGRITSRSITLYDFFLCARMHMFKKKSFFHTFRYNTSEYLSEFCFIERRRRRKEIKAFLLKLLSERRVLLQFHIQAFSSAHQCLFSSSEPTVTVTLFYAVQALSDRLMVWQQATGFLWLQGTVLV